MESDSNFWKTLTKYLWRFYFVGMLLLLLIFGTIRFNVFYLFGEIPDFDELENPNSAKATVVYSEEGKVLGKFYSQENRVRVPFEDISPFVIEALISTEDERFEEHSGIDGRSLLRVIKGIVTFNLDGGGSTISQQLAKNLFQLRTSDKYRGSVENSKVRKVGVKIKEWITSSWLEKAYSKKEIITMYLNTVNHGVKANGIHSGAKIYFSKHCRDLNIQEAATLVGTYAANYAFDPISNPERSKSRRNQVLAQMYRSEAITKEAFDSLKQVPLVTNYSPDSYNKGVATYFREAVKQEVNELVGQDYSVTSDGLKIYTTINYELQKTAENALFQVMKEHQTKFLGEWKGQDPWAKDYFINKIKQTPEYKLLKKEYPTDETKLWNELRKPIKTKIFTYNGEKDTLISTVNKVRHYQRMLRGALLAIDHSNGEIKAWVGGVNKQYFDYDMVAKGSRQVGSTFKPILYSLAIKNGYEPCSKFINVSKSIMYEDGRLWEPRVPKSIDGQEIYMKDALKHSLNNIAAQLVDQLSVDEVIDFASEFDINTSNFQENLSIVLGTNSMSMMDIIKPFQTIANLGMYKKPVKILKIEDEHGKVIYQYKSKENRVLSEIDAYKMSVMLRGVAEGGTAKVLNTKYNLLTNGNMLAGKTGTTQDSKDCWFIGYNNSLVIATWVGPESNAVSYKSTRSWYGASTALPIFAKTLIDGYKNPKTKLKKGPFRVPLTLTDEIIRTQILCESDSGDASEDDYFR